MSSNKRRGVAKCLSWQHFISIILLVPLLLERTNAGNLQEDTLLTTTPAESASSTQPSRIVCYFNGSAVYRPGMDHYAIEDIPAELCTHLIYAFIDVDSVAWDAYVLEADFDVEHNHFGTIKMLSQKHPHLKVQVAVGDWYEDSSKFSEMCAQFERRLNFTISIVKLINAYNFHGVDLTWYYTKHRNHISRSEDKKNFFKFVQDMRAAFDFLQTHLELTITVPMTKVDLKQDYDVKKLCKSVDAVHVMTFESPGLQIEKEVHSTWSMKNSLAIWEGLGCPASKLVVGIPFYARIYLAKSLKLKRDFNFPAFNKICRDLQIKSNGWNIFRDRSLAYSNNERVEYENELSIKEITDFIREKSYAGAMGWTIDMDDFHGFCGRKNTLMHTLYDNLNNYSLIVKEPSLQPKVLTKVPMKVVMRH